MRLTFLPEAWEDYTYWVENDRKLLKRLNRVIEDCMRQPCVGVGKPEPLRHDWSGWWSRRINGEHRLIYRVVGTGDTQTIEIAQCRHHY